MSLKSLGSSFDNDAFKLNIDFLKDTFELNSNKINRSILYGNFLSDDYVVDLRQMSIDAHERFYQLNCDPEKRKNEGLEKLFRIFFPMRQTKKNLIINYVSYYITLPPLTVEECIIQSVSYVGILHIKLKLQHTKTLEEKVCDFVIQEVPLMTDEGVLVLNGNKRVVVMELARCPGVIFTKDIDGNHEVTSAKLYPFYGLWMHFIVHRGQVKMNIDKRDNFSPLLLLKCYPKIGTHEIDVENIDANDNSMKEILSHFYTNKTIKIHGDKAEIPIIQSKYQQVAIPHNMYDKDGKLLFAKGTFILSDNTEYHNVFCPLNELTGLYLAESIVVNQETLAWSTRPIDEIDINILKQTKSIEVLECDDDNNPIVISGFSGMFAPHEYTGELTRTDALRMWSKYSGIGTPYNINTILQIFQQKLFKQTHYDLKAVGRFQLNKILGLNETAHHVTFMDIVKTLTRLVDLQMNRISTDNIDSLQKKIILQFDTIIEQHIHMGLLLFQKQIQERSYNFKNHDPMEINKLSTITNNVVNGLLKVSHLYTDLNYLTGLSQFGKIDSSGKGGSKARVPSSKRDIHYSQLGRICNIQTTEGKKIGIISHLAMYARINALGMLETPYYRVKDGEVDMKPVYLTPYDDEDKIIGDISMYRYDSKLNKLVHRNDYISSLQNGVLSESYYKDIQLVMISNNQSGSVSISLIPRIETNDVYRSMVAANMNLQAMPNYRSEAPYFSTGMDAHLSNAIRSKHDGKVVRIDSSRILVQDYEGVIHRISLKIYEKTNGDSSITYRPLVNLDDMVQVGDIIADGFATRGGELALGNNLMVMFSSHKFTYEDSCLLSQRVRRDGIFESPRIHCYVCNIEDTRHGSERLAKNNIPNTLPKELQHLDECGIAAKGVYVTGKDILVGKITPTADSSFKTIVDSLNQTKKDHKMNFRDTSLRVPSGISGRVIKVEILTVKDFLKDDRALMNDRDKLQAWESNASEELELTYEYYVQEINNVRLSQSVKSNITETMFKIVNHPLNKSLTKLIDDVNMISIKKGSTIFTKFIDQVTSIREKYNYIIKKNINSNVEMSEGILKIIRVYIAESHKISTGDKLAGRCGNKSVVAKVAPIGDMPYLADGTPIDLVLSSISIIARMNNGQLFELFVGYAIYELRKTIGSALRSIRFVYGSLKNDIKLSKVERKELVTLIDYARGTKRDYRVESCNGITDRQLIDIASHYYEKGIFVKFEQFHQVDPHQMLKLLKTLGCMDYKKTHVYDGKTGEKSLYPVVVGYLFMMKLHHIASNKLHARSIGPMAQVSLQPIYGKQRNGGQRLGEMEVWALQGHGSASILNECMNHKSDAIKSKNRMMREIMENGCFSQVNSKHGVSESFRNLASFLKACMFTIDLIDHEGKVIENWQHKPLDLLDIRVRISLATEEDVAEWSNGAVETPETYHYKTFEPVMGGLFDPRIFGNKTSYSCWCKKYQGRKHVGVRCNECEVVVADAIVTRDNMGHIDLAYPVVHSLFTRGTDNKIAKLLGYSNKEIQSLIDLKNYAIIDNGVEILADNDVHKSTIESQHTFKDGDIISKEIYIQLSQDNPDFVAKTGPEAIRYLLESMDFSHNIKQLEEKLKKVKSPLQRRKLEGQVYALRNIVKNNVSVNSMVVTKMPICPSGLRPLVRLPSGQIAASELNTNCRGLVMRNIRCDKSKGLMVPEVEQHERRLLQSAVDSVIGIDTSANKSYNNKSSQSPQSIPVKLTGKEGLIRKSMVGKRVDFSGRSVIISAPNIGVDYCVLPKKIAVKLFKAHIAHYLVTSGCYNTLNLAYKAIKAPKSEVWDALNEIIKDQIVLLNRAPTLHRLGIMAFKIKLWDSNAIGVNPMVCLAFNADFDGDQMAVHLNISNEAISEAVTLMLPSKNLISATNGKLILYTTKDMIFGIYAMMSMNNTKAIKKYYTVDDAEYGLFNGSIKISDPINTNIRRNGVISNITTTMGRIKLWNIIPDNTIDIFKYNKPLTNVEIKEIMEDVRDKLGDDALAAVADKLQQIGFEYATKLQASFGLEDFITLQPDLYKDITKLLSDGSKKVRQYIENLDDGFMTFEEFKNKCISQSSVLIIEAKKIVQKFVELHPENPIVQVVQSGARGSISNLLQLFVAKGNVLDINGEISHMMIFSNHTTGMNLLEYFILSYGARKNTTDVSLRTAESGYLTRKLVDSSHSCVVTQVDCKTSEYITLSNVFSDGKLQYTVYDQIVGRTLAQSIIIESDKYNIQLPENLLITKDIVKILKDFNIQEVSIRSPVHCESEIGVCVACYGADISSGAPVHIGEGVGIIAAQSIGEPGTQLTMRAFHSGGIANIGTNLTKAITPFSGIVKWKNIFLMESSDSINISKNGEILIVNDRGDQLANFNVPYGAQMLTKDGDNIMAHTVMATWSGSIPLIAEKVGVCRVTNLFLNINHEYQLDSQTQENKIFITNTKRSPAVEIIKDGIVLQKIFLQTNTLLHIKDGDNINLGDMIGNIRITNKSIDIVGGLQQITLLLDNRIRANPAVIAHEDGRIVFIHDQKGTKIYLVNDEDNKQFLSHVNIDNCICKDQQYVKKGDILTTGTASLQDIHDYCGINRLIKYFVSKMKGIYMDNGLDINNKHIEIVLSQMCKSYVVCSGQYRGLSTTRVGLYDLIKVRGNKFRQWMASNAKRIIKGITNTALDSESFLSAISFQNTVKGLVDHSLKNSIDSLISPKSSLLTGLPSRIGTQVSHIYFTCEAYKDRNMDIPDVGFGKLFKNSSISKTK